MNPAPHTVLAAFLNSSKSMAGARTAAACRSRLSRNPLPLEIFSFRKYRLPMPIYEFHCEECGKDSEILIRSSDRKSTKCPECGSTKLEKKFSTFASANAGGT